MIVPFKNDKKSVIDRINDTYETDIELCLSNCWYLYDNYGENKKDKLKALIHLAKCFIKLKCRSSALEALKTALVIDRNNLIVYDLILGLYDEPFNSESYKFYEHDAMRAVKRFRDSDPENQAFASGLVDKIMDTYFYFDGIFEEEERLQILDREILLDKYLDDICDTAMDGDYDTAVKELESLKHKYGENAKYYAAYAKVCLIYDEYEKAYDAVNKGIAIDTDNGDLLICELYCKASMHICYSDTLEKLAVHFYETKESLYSVIYILFELCEYESILDVTGIGDFREDKDVMIIRACALFNLGSVSQAEYIFKRVYMLYREFSKVNYYYNNGIISVPSDGLFNETDAVSMNRNVLDKLKNVLRLASRKQSHFNLNDDMKELIKLSNYIGNDSEKVRKLILEEFDDKIFIENEDFFKTIMISGDVPIQIQAAVLYKFITLYPADRFDCLIGEYVYSTQIRFDDFIVNLADTLKKAYFYAASIMSYSIKFDAEALYSALYRLLSTGLYNSELHNDYKSLGALLAKISYTSMYNYDLSTLAELFATKKTKIAKLRSELNKNKNLYSKSDLEAQMVSNISKIFESFTDGVDFDY